MEFRVGRANALFHPKLVEIRPVRGIQLPAAVVLGVIVVIGDAFPAEIIVGALHASGNFLRTSIIHAVLERLALISLQSGGRASAQIKTAGENQARLQKESKFSFHIGLTVFALVAFDYGRLSRQYNKNLCSATPGWE